MASENQVVLTRSEVAPAMDPMNPMDVMRPSIQDAPIELEKIETPPKENIDISPESKSKYEQMSAKAKNAFNSVYETVYKTPYISRVAAKMEISYNKRWIDHHEKKAANLKGKFDARNNTISSFDTAIKTLEKVGGPAALIDIKKLEEKKAKILNKRDKIQSRFEKRENKVKIYTNERDRVSDKLIDRYEKSLEPINQEIEKAKNKRLENDLKFAALDLRYKNKEAETQKIVDTLEELMGNLQAAGRSDRKIRKSESVKALQAKIDTAYDDLDKARADLENKQRDNERIMADLEKHANPLRDKVNRFIRIKQSRPIDFGVKARLAEIKPNSPEEISVRPRPEEGENVEEKLSVEDKDKPKLNVYLVAWKEFLSQKVGGENNLSPKEKTLTLEDFTKSTNLDKSERLERNDFKNILKIFYMYKKIPADSIDKYIDEFLKQEEIKLPKKPV